MTCARRSAQVYTISARLKKYIHSFSCSSADCQLGMQKVTLGGLKKDSRSERWASGVGWIVSFPEVAILGHYEHSPLRKRHGLVNDPRLQIKTVFLNDNEAFHDMRKPSALQGPSFDQSKRGSKPFGLKQSWLMCKKVVAIIRHEHLSLRARLQRHK